LGIEGEATAEPSKLLMDHRSGFSLLGRNGAKL